MERNGNLTKSNYLDRDDSLRNANRCDYLQKLDIVQKGYTRLKESHAISLVFRDLEVMNALFDAIRNCYQHDNATNGVNDEAVVVDNRRALVVAAEDLLAATRAQLLNEVQSGNWDGLPAIYMNRIINALPCYIDPVFAQTITLGGYIAMLREMRKAGKKLVKNATANDVGKARHVCNKLSYIDLMLNELKKTGVKCASDEVPTKVIINTFDDFEAYRKRAYACCCYMTETLDYRVRDYARMLGAN